MIWSFETPSGKKFKNAGPLGLVFSIKKMG
jgi:hypothetical protein